MVIRDNDFDAIGIRQLNLRRRRDAIVAGHDHTNPILMRLLDQMIVQPIAVVDPMGDSRVHPGAQHPQAFCQNIRRTDAVHVIIPDDPDPDALLYGRKYFLHSPVHIL